jgi:hypothetical protein
LLNVQYTKCMRGKEDLCAGIMLGYSHLFSNWRWLFPHHKEDCVLHAHAHVALELSVLAIRDCLRI